MVRSLRPSLVSLAVACAMLAACGQRSAEKGDAGGGDDDPRIVALSPAIAQTLRDLGLGEHLVGRHGFDAWTDQSIPVCGDQAGVDAETLLAVRPTHVLVEGGTGAPAALTKLAGSRDWIVESWRLLTLEDVRASVVDLCDIFRDEIEDGRCDQLLAEFDRAMSPRAAGEPPAENAAATAAGAEEPGPPVNQELRVLLLMGVDPPAALGPGSFHHQMLERIGGPGSAPAIEQGGPYMVLSAEDVLALNPDAVMLFRPKAGEVASDGGAPSGTGAAALGPLRTLDLAAVRTGRVAVIEDPMGFVPGTNLIRLADEMTESLRQW